MARNRGLSVMRLYLVQHAHAISREEDPARNLSESGVEDIKRMVAFLKSRKIKVSKIYHSGKVRARKTAELLSKGISSEEDTKGVSELAPLDDPRPWIDRLRKEENDLVLVGHLPHLSILAGLLLAGNPERNVVRFKRGGVVCLERDEARNWSLLWSLIPNLVKSH